MISPNFDNFLILANVFLGGGYAEQLHGAFMQCDLPLFAGLYWEPLPGKAVWKILAKSKFGEFTSTFHQIVKSKI